MVADWDNNSAVFGIALLVVGRIVLGVAVAVDIVDIFVVVVAAAVF